MSRAFGLSRIARSLAPFAAALITGCVLYGGADDYKTCADVVCGDHATCGGDGQCFCDAGYGGNPYEGCKSAQPEVDPSCSKECGQNAYCSDGECYCELDHVYVCGANAGCLPTANLCDAQPDCPDGADEQPAVCSKPTFQEWLLTDSCNDAEDIQWRLFAQDRDWVWPNKDEVFRSGGLNVDTYQIIECFEGETICFAGESGETKWGFNLDGTGSCDACCAQCGSQELLDLGYLTCE